MTLEFILGPEITKKKGPAGFVGVTVHGKPPNSDGHNFFVRTLFWMFLDSMGSTLRLEFIHLYILIILELILGPKITKKVGPVGCLSPLFMGSLQFQTTIISLSELRF